MKFYKFLKELKTKQWAPLVNFDRLHRYHYTDPYRPLCIHCIKHGEFIESPHELLKNWRCPECCIDKIGKIATASQYALPDEIILQICDYLSLDDLKALRATCRQMREVIAKSTLECKWIEINPPARTNHGAWFETHCEWIIPSWSEHCSNTIMNEVIEISADKCVVIHMPARAIPVSELMYINMVIHQKINVR